MDLWPDLTHPFFIPTLSWLVSRLAERYLTFFKTLKQPKDFQWIDECHKAFEELKGYLSTPPLLNKLETEELYLYLAISPSVIGSILIRKENQVQKPVYHVNKVLQNIETGVLDSKTNFCCCNLSQKASFLFSSPYYGHPQGPTTQNDPAQTKHLWQDGQIGPRALWVRSCIPTPTLHKGASINRFCGRVHHLEGKTRGDRPSRGGFGEPTDDACRQILKRQ